MGLLKFKGSNSFRLRLLLSTLSGKSVRIDDIRSNDSNPGLRDFEASFLRLLEKLTNGCVVEINETGEHEFFMHVYVCACAYDPTQLMLFRTLLVLFLFFALMHLFLFHVCWFAIEKSAFPNLLISCTKASAEALSALFTCPRTPATVQHPVLEKNLTYFCSPAFVRMLVRTESDCNLAGGKSPVLCLLVLISSAHAPARTPSWSKALSCLLLENSGIASRKPVSILLRPCCMIGRACLCLECSATYPLPQNCLSSSQHVFWVALTTCLGLRLLQRTLCAVAHL